MSIIFDNENKVFFLNTKNTEYQIKINEYNMVLHSFYGPAVGNEDMSYLITTIDRGFSGNSYEASGDRGTSPDTLPFEYSTYGAGDYRISAFTGFSQNGSRTTDLRYSKHTIFSGKRELKELPYVREMEDKTDSLIIELSDDAAGIRVELIYSVFEEKDIITRSSRITNFAKETYTLTKAASMSMDFPRMDMDFIHFHGKHAFERKIERTAVLHDIQIAGSKRGASSHHQNPFVILCDGTTTENNGIAYGFMLVYSGGHAQEVEKDQAGSIRIISGIDSTSFAWKLGEGESFETPEVILACSSEGFNGLSYLYHRIIRDNVCPRKFRNVKRPVLINNWEGTYFDFDEEKIIEIEDAAAELGCEMLVLDDGWFGKRNDDNAGLGDWFVNKAKLPGGIKKIADHANSLGMKFGIWFEPEMVNEDSYLFRKHPEWALSEPGRKPVMGRNQMVLDMSREDVVDYIYESMSKILDSANIEYVKWDFNRSLANVYSNAEIAENQGEIAHRFILGTYELLHRLSEAYPNLMIEGCSGGGGRFDAGMLFYCPQIWCSDNTDAIDRLIIQKGTSYGYPISTVGSHVSASPNHQNGRQVPIDTRAIVAMSGTFGYELDPRKLSDSEKECVRKQIESFNRFYELIQKGRYYRLDTKESEDYFTSWEFVSEDKKEVLLNAVVTQIGANPEIPAIKLAGLEPGTLYEVDYIYSSGHEVVQTQKKVYLGSALMNGGYILGFVHGVYPSLQVHFKAKNG